MDAVVGGRLTEHQETMPFQETVSLRMILQHVRESINVLRNVGKTRAPEISPESRRREIVPGPEEEQHSQFAPEMCARMRRKFWRFI